MKTNQKEGLRDLVTEVGRELLNFWPARSTKNLTYRLKDNQTPVTEADERASDMVVSGLSKLFPGDLVISEEGPSADDRDLSREVVWFVDPLDGTRTFMAGGNEFSVLLGRATQGIVDFGIMYFPALGLYAEGATGQGVFVNGVPVRCSPLSTVPRRISRPRALGNYSGNIEENHVTGRALLGLARGEYDLGVFKLDSFGPHDFAAASIIIREAGGCLVNELGDPDFFCRLQKPRYILGGHGELVQQTLTALKESPPV